MHRLLARQFRRYFPEATQFPEGWEAFVGAVGQAYEEFKEDRHMLEHSMEISSQELLQANAEMRAVLAAFPDLFIWLDEKGCILETKAGTSGDPRLSGGDLRGLDFGCYPDRDVARQLCQAVETVARTRAVTAFEYEVCEGGEYTVFEARLFPLVDGKALTIIRDITDTRRVELAEAANEAKTEFLANMSHELRTPLHGVLSFARLGRKRADTVEPSSLGSYFDRIQSSGESLLDLLDDLLDLAKLDMGHTSFRLQSVDLWDILAREVDQFTSRFSEKGVSFSLRKPEQQHAVLADPVRIAQVLRNLLSNAVHHAADGGAVEVAGEYEDDHLVVSVSDDGPGIPLGELETIFDRFVQSSTTKTGAGGTGLGLSISKEIVEAHAGRIWAENGDAHGAVFRVRLPLETAAVRETA